jgi:hypothetical protein
MRETSQQVKGLFVWAAAVEKHGELLESSCRKQSLKAKI